MPAFGNVVILDGKSTPVSHTFAPDARDTNGVALYADCSPGVAAGFWTLSINRRAPVNNGQQVYKVSAKLRLPTLAVTSPSTGTGIQPAPTVAYAMEAHVEFLIPAQGTLAERKDVLALAKNLLATSTMSSVIENLEAIYS